jgi:hypothetical protein
LTPVAVLGGGNGSLAAAGDLALKHFGLMRHSVLG